MDTVYLDWISFYIAFLQWDQWAELHDPAQSKDFDVFLPRKGCLSRGRKDLFLDQILTFKSKLSNEAEGMDLEEVAIPS